MEHQKAREKNHIRKIAFAAGVIIVLLLSWSMVNVNRSKSPKPQPSGSKNKSEIILYYGKGCPHCANVERFIQEKGIRQKIVFQEKETWYNKNNAKEMLEKAKICKISEDDLGVPFLWTGDNCLIGDEDIINFFKKRANIT